MFKKKIKTLISVAMADLMLMASGVNAYAVSLGDINSDNAINAVDASDILAEYARVSTNQKSQFTEEQQTAADVDNNCFINGLEASLILSFYAYRATSGTMEFEAYLKNPPATTTKATTTTTTTTTTATTTTTTTTTTAPVKDTNIVGEWAMEDFSSDSIGASVLVFKEDKYGSLYYDTSKLMTINNDGLTIEDSTIPSVFFSRDNDIFIILYRGHKIMEMKCLEQGEGYYGKYHLYGGELYDSLVENLTSDKDMDPSTLDLSVVFDEGYSEVWINNVFKYENTDITIIFSETNGFFEMEGKEGYVYYTIDGDTLTIWDDETVEPITYNRVKK